MRAFRGRALVAGAGAAAVCLGVAVYLVVASATGPPPLAQASATPTPRPSPTVAPTPDPTPSPTPTPSASPTPIPQERVTVLVLGSDSNWVRVARGDAPRIDTIIVASVSAGRDEIVLISIPRDTVDVPMPGSEVWHGKINTIYALRGMNAMTAAVETLLELPIDHHVLVNMDDFSAIVDALGGIEVDVPFAMNDPKVLLSIPAGRQQMSGTVALQYVRSRSLDSDFGRAARQQAVVLAMARRLANPALVPDPATVVSRLGSLETDLQLSDLPTALALVQASIDAHVTSVVLRPPQFAISAGLSGARGWVMVPNVEEIRSWVREATAD